MAVVVIAVLASGCSSSGGEQAVSTGDAAVINTTDAGVTDSAEDDSTTDTGTDIDSAPDPTENNESNNDVVDSSMGDAQPDPMTPISTVVDFEITVPAHISDALQLEMSWGSKELATWWVGDELWAASDTFPVDARQLLTITFTDVNGDVVLGVYEADFHTGINASEIYKISAEQFETEQWDDDGDGVSNLAESVAGTNPLIIETEQLDVRVAFYDAGGLLANVWEYEQKLVELPYFEQSEHVTNRPWIGDQASYVSSRITIDIDENGTGTFDDYNLYIDQQSDRTTINNNAVRTNTGDSITYVATWDRFHGGAAVGNYWGITSDTTVIDAQMRTQTAELYSGESGTGNGGRLETTYTLTGHRIADSAGCEADYGVLTYEFHKVFTSADDVLITTVSKGIDDEYWNVTTTTQNGSVVDEYLVQNLGKGFYCDLVGL